MAAAIGSPRLVLAHHGRQPAAAKVASSSRAASLWESPRRSARARLRAARKAASSARRRSSSRSGRRRAPRSSSRRSRRSRRSGPLCSLKMRSSRGAIRRSCRRLVRSIKAAARSASSTRSSTSRRLTRWSVMAQPEGVAGTVIARLRSTVRAPGSTRVRCRWSRAGGARGPVWSAMGPSTPTASASRVSPRRRR